MTAWSRSPRPARRWTRRSALTPEIAKAEGALTAASAKVRTVQDEYNRKLAELFGPVNEAETTVAALRDQQKQLRTDGKRVLNRQHDPAIDRQLAPHYAERTKLLAFLEAYAHRDVATIEANISTAKTTHEDLLQRGAAPEADNCSDRIKRMEEQLADAERKSAACQEPRVRLVEVEATIAELEASKPGTIAWSVGTLDDGTTDDPAAVEMEMITT